MKTIQFITESIQRMKELQIPANIEIGTFKIDSTGSLINWAGKQGEYKYSFIKFRLNFRPDHIQTLLNMGVRIDFDSVVMAGISENAKRFKAGREAIKQGRYAPYYYMGDPANKQTGVIENWLYANASCSPSVLAELDKYCRDNHRGEISISNDTQLGWAGWKFKTKYSSQITIESQYFNPKKIRRNAINKPANKLQPVEKRLLKLK